CVQVTKGPRAHLAAGWLRLEHHFLARERVPALARRRGRLVDRLQLDEAVEVELAAAALAQVGRDDRGQRLEHFPHLARLQIGGHRDGLDDLAPRTTLLGGRRLESLLLCCFCHMKGSLLLKLTDCPAPCR